MIGLFKSFYQAADNEALATAFAKGLKEQLGEKTISMAALQHYFIMQRKATAEEASKQVEKVIEEMETMGKGKGKEEEKKDKDTDEEGEKKKDKKGGEKLFPGGSKAEDDDEGGEAAGEAPAAEAPTGKKSKGGKQVHVHIY